MSKKESGLLAPNVLGSRKSSLFSRDSFIDEQMKRKEANRSFVSMPQQTDSEQAIKIKPKVLYENSYKIEPDRKFRSSEAQAIIQKVLETNLKTETYDAGRSAYNAKLIAQLIKDNIKDLNYERYKIAVIASVGQLNDQGLQVASRCVWDTNFDTSASASFKNKSLFAVATVFAVYYE